VYTKGVTTESVSARFTIWGLGLREFLASDMLLGWGLGGWSRIVPRLQAEHGVLLHTGQYLNAHNEYVQWLCETGLVGVVLLAGWGWRHRAMFWHTVLGGAVVALAVNACTFFPLHMSGTALLAIVVIGLATADPDLKRRAYS
jgi:O-antigen ligase